MALKARLITKRLNMAVLCWARKRARVFQRVTPTILLNLANMEKKKAPIPIQIFAGMAAGAYSRPLYKQKVLLWDS